MDDERTSVLGETNGMIYFVSYLVHEFSEDEGYKETVHSAGPFEFEDACWTEMFGKKVFAYSVVSIDPKSDNRIINCSFY